MRLVLASWGALAAVAATIPKEDAPAHVAAAKDAVLGAKEKVRALVYVDVCVCVCACARVRAASSSLPAVAAAGDCLRASQAPACASQLGCSRVEKV